MSGEGLGNEKGLEENLEIFPRHTTRPLLQDAEIRATPAFGKGTHDKIVRILSLNKDQLSEDLARNTLGLLMDLHQSPLEVSRCTSSTLNMKLLMKLITEGKTHLSHKNQLLVVKNIAILLKSLQIRRLLVKEWETNPSGKVNLITVKSAVKAELFRTLAVAARIDPDFRIAIVPFEKELLSSVESGDDQECAGALTCLFELLILNRKKELTQKIKAAAFFGPEAAESSKLAVTKALEDSIHRKTTATRIETCRCIGRLASYQFEPKDKLKDPVFNRLVSLLAIDNWNLKAVALRAIVANNLQLKFNGYSHTKAIIKCLDGVMPYFGAFLALVQVIACSTEHPKARNAYLAAKIPQKLTKLLTEMDEDSKTGKVRLTKVQMGAIKKATMSAIERINWKP